jgi:sporulation protein YlmC with PRC-barrel domain
MRLAPSKVPGALDGVRAGDLIGKSVYNIGGESVGGIEDIVVRREDNEVAALIGMGGFLGLDDKQVAVLLNDLEIQGGNIVVKNLTRTDFQQRSAYQKNGWTRYDPDRLIGSAMVR